MILDASRPEASGSRHLLDGLERIAIGRGGTRQVARTEGTLRVELPDSSLSSAHAVLERGFGTWTLRDVGSKNGSFVDGERATEILLQPGALIELGSSFFRIVADTPPDDTLDLELVNAPAHLGIPTIDVAFAELLAQLERVAGSLMTIVIHGASGTGKEVLARAIHAASGRTGAFAAVNCAAIPANLVESELFGVKKGAFSGAANDRAGWVQTSDRGTLFLDEIGDLPLPAQGALLRVLQEREVTPVGSTQTIPVDLRVIAATHRDLDDLVRRELFRADLLARLAGFRISLPPLSERTADLGLLLTRLIPRIPGLAPGGHPGFAPAAARQLLSYSWPLNVRELEQVVGASSVLAGKRPVGLEHLPEAIRTARIVPERGSDALEGRLRELLERHRGNISAVAREMDKDRRQVQRWIAKFALDPRSFE